MAKNIDTKRVQAGLRMDTLLRTSLSKEELELFPREERSNLRHSLEAQIALIDELDMLK